MSEPSAVLEAPEAPEAPARPRSRTAVFIVFSVLLHVAAFLLMSWQGASKLPIEIKLPAEVEFGLAENDPGAQGSPPPAAAPTPPEPKPVKLKAPKSVSKPDSEAFVVVDAGVRADAGPPEQVAAAEGAPADTSGEGQGVAGEGLGFGAGGFGSGRGGPLGAVIGFHADLDRIRANALTLETSAILGLIPEWEKLLAGSGIELKHLSRVFVATPSLARSDLVVSLRYKGAQSLVEQAAQRLAEERGQSASFRQAGGLAVAPWFNRGPTEREVALVAPHQLVIARPRDVPRVLGVSAALARRHEKQPDMEHVEGAAALLAMYEGEAAALSVEGARKFVVGENDYVPLGLRLSLFYIDEFHARLRVTGYYESQKAAASGLERIDELRHQIAEHPKVQYFGLRSAIDEATLERIDDTLRLETVLTLHQTRYLMSFVRSALKPRD